MVFDESLVGIERIRDSRGMVRFSFSHVWPLWESNVVKGYYEFSRAE